MTTKEAMVPMRDGARLHTGVCLPEENEDPLPVVLFRATRGVALNSLWAHVFVQAGYAYVMQSVRGCGDCEGDP